MTDPTPTPEPDALSRVERLLTPARRLYLYRVTVALLPLLVAIGALSEGLAGQLALLGAAVLGLGVPAIAGAHVQR